ncbi:MAG: 16S rRNA (guanine(527)-N(7))-methyltransferase RsmG [Cypionkella sp.]
MTFVQGEVPGWLNVSRETLEKLYQFQRLVEKWNGAINLVAKNRIAEIWDRHILDSAQLLYCAPAGAEKWCDIGSGGGFPGIVIAIIAQSEYPALRVTLVESDQRKAVFLRQASRELDLEVTVAMDRIENLAPLSADILSARALSPLIELLPMAKRHLKDTGTAIFPKGAAWEQEVSMARNDWSFHLENRSSHTSDAAKILILKDVEHV